MIKIAVCDDMDYMRREIKNSLLKFSFQENVNFYVDEFESGEQLITSSEHYNLIFMDYDFGEKKKNGFEISREIHKNNKGTAIVFLTSYEDIVFDAFEVSPFRFLVKPIDEKSFTKAMLDYMNLLEEDKYIKIKIDSESHMIKIDEIIYVEGNGKNCLFHLNRKKENVLECKLTLSLIDKMMMNNKKMNRCHKSFIVNFDYISKYNRTEIELTTGERIFMSRRKYIEFSEAYTRYLFR